MDSPINSLVLEAAQQTGCRPFHHFAHEAMACAWDLFIVGEAEEYAGQAARVAFDEVDRLERELSRFIPSSDVFRINALDPGESMRVGLATLECLRLATAAHQQTGGAFDVTIGALLDARRGDDSLIQALDATSNPTRHGGMDLLEINEAEYEVSWQGRGACIDLGGIGKGYALDRMAALLRDWRIETALIHSGQSTVLALGIPEADQAWAVSLRNPHQTERSLGEVYLYNRALSGSGIMEQGYHIIDPRTGQAAQGKLATWAIADSAARSDALSTAFMVMAPEEVEQYCNEHAGVVGILLTGEPEQPALTCFGELARLAPADAAPESGE